MGWLQSPQRITGIADCHRVKVRLDIDEYAVGLKFGQDISFSSKPPSPDEQFYI